MPAVQLLLILRMTSRYYYQNIWNIVRIEENVITEVQKVKHKIFNTRESNETIHGVRIKSAPSLVMCNNREGNLLTDKTLVLAKLKQHSESLRDGGTVSTWVN